MTPPYLCLPWVNHQINLIDLKKMAYPRKFRLAAFPVPTRYRKMGSDFTSVLTDLHGFVIVSVPDQKTVARVELPPAPPSGLQSSSPTPRLMESSYRRTGRNSG